MATAPQVIESAPKRRGRPSKQQSIAPDTPPCDSQPITAKIRRKSTKPTTLQTAVIAKYAQGETKTNIAEDLGIGRGTVASILCAADIEQHLLQGRSDCVRMIPRSIDVIDQRLSKGSETAALAILRGTQVLQNQQVIANQLNLQANTWITMRERSQAEAAQIIEAECVNPAENTPTSSGATLPTSKP